MKRTALASKRGRPPKRFDPQIAEKVQDGASVGHSHDVIARAVGLSDKTLRKLYPKELRRGTFEMLLEVENAHYRAAINGNVTAQIHILGCKGGWINPNRARNAKSVPPPKIAEDTKIVVRLKLDSELAPPKVIDGNVEGKDTPALGGLQ